ncbi:MAG: 3-aminobutyryl-CoA aminotransferase [Gemmatimonadaceae bacterium]|nr:3-aminobutyryl-CoA aminotransferase [Gemmatimonadaceae bacterium]
MPFRRFFGRGNERARPADAPPDDAEEAGKDDDATAQDDDAGTPEWDAGIPEGQSSATEIEGDWRARAAAVIPGGASTGSKQPQNLFGDAASEYPGHFLRASGCHLVTVGERTLLDCTMALGAVSLGYADEGVTRAVVSAAAAGHVAGLAHYLEIEVAERLCDLIPCAERVRFLKSGAEATAAAVRIARAATGRTRVIATGYLGWHDWSNAGPGIPAGAHADVTRVPFDDMVALQDAVRDAARDLAAIVLEPVVDREPSPEWLGAARSLCDEAGAVLIFDEMKTGFRLRPGGYQEVSGVTPDLATFGKALANGYPLAAVVGRDRVMSAAQETWISSTLAGEAVALAAAAAVIERYDSEGDVCARLGEIGAAMRAGVDAAIRASGVGGVRIEGLDAMWQLRFDRPDVERAFLERAVRHGALFKRGAYNYASLAHGEGDVLTELESIASAALVELMEEGIA